MTGHRLTTSYDDELRLFPSRLARVALLILAVAFILIPLQMPDFHLSVINRAGIFAIGALGLNLLTGYTGEVSLGHAFFIAIGAYTWVYFAGDLEMPMVVWLPAAAIIAGAAGALVGPFALRLRGNYLAIVSLGLVFIGTHIWYNWESLTGGFSGASADTGATLGPLDFGQLNIGGDEMSFHQGYFWLVWGLVALTALAVKNIVRSRPGRALQAIRDRDIAAAVIGVDLARYKVASFAVSSALAGMSGALFGSYIGFLRPDGWTLLLSIQFIAMIIVGGVGTVFGSILGALFVVAGPLLIEEYSESIPLVSSITGGTGVAVGTFNQLLFGVMIVLFLVLEPRGLAGLWFRAKSYFKSWPFSY